MPKYKLKLNLSDGTEVTTTNSIDIPDIEKAFTPTLVGTRTSANLSSGYVGFQFPGASNPGLYMFTYGNCMIMLPIYNLQTMVEYKVAAALVNSSGSFSTKILTYRLTSSGNLQIYQKENYIPSSYTGYLFRINLY